MRSCPPLTVVANRLYPATFLSNSYIPVENKYFAKEEGQWLDHPKVARVP